MAPYLGDFKAGDVIRYLWHTNSAAGALAARTVLGTIALVKDDGTTEITAGITDTADFDGVTGQHLLEIDVDTAGLTPGSDYFARLTGATVDGVAGVGAALMSFSFRNRGNDVVARGQLTAASASGFTLADNGSRDKVKAGDYILVGIKDGDTGFGFMLIDAYTPGTGVGTLRAGSTFPTTPAVGTYYEVIQFPSAEAFQDSDFGDFATELDAIKAVTDDVAAMLEDDGGTPRYTANALELGPAGGSGGSVNVATIAPAAVADIQAGLATGANLAALQTDVDALAAALVTALADLDNIQTRLPAALVGGKMDAVAEATVDNDLIAAATLDLADAIEPGVTLRGAMRAALAVLVSLSTGIQATTTAFKSTDVNGSGVVQGSKTRVTATRDTDADRLSVTLDVSAV